MGCGPRREEGTFSDTNNDGTPTKPFWYDRDGAFNAVSNDIGTTTWTRDADLRVTQEFTTGGVLGGVPSHRIP